jgi:hypothetical protein
LGFNDVVEYQKHSGHPWYLDYDETLVQVRNQIYIANFSDLTFPRNTLMHTITSGTERLLRLKRETVFARYTIATPLRWVLIH